MRYIISLFALGFALMSGVGESHAQTIGSAPRGGELLTTGEKALAKGQFKSAARSFAKALRSDDLTDVQVAKALYQRGVANERMERPAQAIADITSALYLPGLKGADRARAYLSRGRAYDAVGMSALASADKSRAASGGVSDRQIASAGGPSFRTSSQAAGSGASQPSFATSVEPARRRSSAPAFRTRSNAPTPAPSRQQVASFETRTRPAPRQEQPIARFRTTIQPNDASTRQPRPNTRIASATPDGARSNWNTSASGQQAALEQKAESGSRVGRFFGNVWNKATGGGDENNLTAAAPAPVAAPSASPAPQWNQTVSAASAPRPRPNARISSPASPVATVQPAAAPAGGGGYRIQLAALRSDGEAQASWKRLQSKYKTLLAGRQPNIVRTELGGLGTFYRVQLGPFADKAGPQQLCNDFKRGGLDCFLLAP